MWRFLGGWVADTIRFGLGLAVAISALQVPALTHAYTAALQQVADGTRRDIDQRKQIARDYYRWTDQMSDAAAVEALRPLEPANADGLANSVQQEALLRQTVGELMAAPELTRPLHAAWDLATDAAAAKRGVFRTALNTHVPQVVLSTAAAVYGLAGLMLGLLLAQVLLAIFRGFGRRRTPAPRIVADRRHPRF